MQFSKRFSAGSRGAKWCSVIFSLNFFLIGSSVLYAQDVWQGPNPDESWFTPTNWTLGIPTAAQAAVVDNGATAQIKAATVVPGTAQIAAAPAVAVASTLTIGATVPGSTVQLLTGFTLTLTNPLIIGTDGTFRFSGGLLTGAGGAIQNNGTIVFDAPGPGNQTLVHDITGSGSVIVDITGGGILTVSSNNTYSGATTLIAGTFQAASATAFSPNSAFTVNSTLDLNGFNNTIGSLSGNGVVLNNGGATATLTVGNDDTSTTFGGVLRNGNSVLQLTKIGAGTLTLTGANTYTGGTTISAGKLQIGNGGTSGSIVGNVTDNATLVFDRSDSVTFGGAISGTGSLVNLGTGMLTLTGANTYTGGTTVSTGTLQAGSATGFSPSSAFRVNSILNLNGFNNTIGSLSGNGVVLNNGGATATLTVGNDDTSTAFGGVLQDGNSVLQLTKIGTGTLTLTGANTYTGGTTVSTGTLQAGSATGFSPSSAFRVNSILDLNGFNNTIGSLSGNGTVLNNGPTTATLTVGNDNTNTTFGGVLKDGSVLQLVKSGTGTFTLTGPNTYTGTTTINSGSLIVDGSIASVLTLVNAGGLLGGHGTIGGNLVNNGTVGQGNSPGTLTVSGNYAQNAGGTLRIGVAGLAPGQHDLLAVNGHAAVAGTLQIIRQGNFNLQPGNQITLLTANNGVSGTFGTVDNGLADTGTIVQVQVTSLPNSIVLEGTEGSFAQLPGLTPNEAAVANMLDSAAGDPRAAPLFQFLNSQPLANLPNDLNLISPAQITSFHAIGAAHGNTQIANLGGRMANIRAGVTGFSSIGLTLNGSVASSGEGFAGESGPEGKSGPSVLAPSPDNRWGVFVTGIGEFTNVDSTANAAGYDIDTGGITFGIDYRVCPFFAIGLSAGYAHTRVNIDADGGNIDVNSGKFGLYATAFTQGFYVDAAINGGPSGYNSHRTALQGTANGSTDSGDFNALVATGYDWKFGGLTIGPTASFQYGYIGLNAFTETGSLAPLNFPDQTAESERTAFGVKTSYDWKIGHVDVLPEFRAAWQHEYGDTEYSIVANLASGAGNSFTVTGPPVGRDSLLIGVGAAVVWNERVTTYIYYDGEFARTNYLSNNVSAGVRVTF